MQSVHGTAFLLGVVVYIGYISLMVPAADSQQSSSKDDDDDCAQSKQRRTPNPHNLPWPLISLFVLTLACYLMVLPPADEQCQNEMTDVELIPTAGEAEGATPVQLLEAAHEAIDGGDDETGRVHLELCVTWTSDHTTVVPLLELKAQLECHQELLDQGMASVERAAAIASSGRRILAAAEQRRAENPRIFEDLQVEWAKVAHGWLQVQFEVATQAIRSQKSISRERVASGEAIEAPGKATKADGYAMQALAAAGATAVPLENMISSCRAAIEVLRSRKLKSDEHSIRDLLKRRAAAAVAVLGLVRESRAVAAEIHRNDSPEVRKKLRCPAEALSHAESLAVAAAGDEAKLKSEFRHKALFALGEYWSEKVVEESSEPSYNEKWVFEGKSSGSYVPANIAYAESLLAAGAVADGDDKADRMAMRALRFYQHAKLLAKRHHDAAAEWRYRAAAALAVRYKRKKLAAHSLSRLAYLFIQRSRHADALKVLEEAKVQGGNALSMFLETMLLRRSGGLVTDKALRASDDVLVAVAGKLPSKALEAEREHLLTTGHFWRSVAATNIWQCFKAKNVAHFLICVICRLLYKTEDSVAAHQNSESEFRHVEDSAVEEEPED